MEQNISLITQVICSVESCSFEKIRPFENNITRSGSVVGRHRTSKIKLQGLYLVKFNWTVGSDLTAEFFL